MMSLNIKKILLFTVAGTGIVLIFAWFYSGNNSDNVAEIPAEEMTSEEIVFTDEQLQQYYAVYDDPFVKHVRVGLNGYLDGSNSGMLDPSFTIESREGDGMTAGLESFDRAYYQGKFIVFALNDHLGGGKEVDLMFQDKPDRMFGAWVYNIGDDTYDLRGFWQKSDYTPEVMEEIRKDYGRYLADKEHAI